LEVKTMKHRAPVLVVLFSGLAYSAPPKTMGTLTNKVPEKPATLNVADAVAVFNAEDRSLAIHLLSRRPNEEELSMLQKHDDWFADGLLKLSWNLERESVGVTRKAFVWIYTKWGGSSVNVNKWGREITLSLSGSLKEGQEIAVSTKGSERWADWDLDIKTKVYKLKKE
jgi:hypothetical protein